MPILTYQERLASADISPRCEDSMYKSFPTSILEDFESSPISQSPSSSGCSSASITSSSEEDADQSSNSDLDDNASAKSGQSGQFISDSSPVTADGDAPSLSSMAGSTNSNVPSAQTIRRSKFNTEYNTRGDPIVWRNVVIFTLLHIFAFRGSYILFTQRLWGALIFSKYHSIPWLWPQLPWFPISQPSTRPYIPKYHFRLASLLLTSRPFQLVLGSSNYEFELPLNLVSG